MRKLRHATLKNLPGVIYLIKRLPNNSNPSSLFLSHVLNSYFIIASSNYLREIYTAITFFVRVTKVRFRMIKSFL